MEEKKNILSSLPDKAGRVLPRDSSERGRGKVSVSNGTVAPNSSLGDGKKLLGE